MLRRREDGGWEWVDITPPPGEGDLIRIPIRDAFAEAHARLKRRYDEQRPVGQLSLDVERRPK